MTEIDNCPKNHNHNLAATPTLHHTEAESLTLHTSRASPQAIPQTLCITSQPGDHPYCTIPRLKASHITPWGIAPSNKGRKPLQIRKSKSK